MPRGARLDAPGTLHHMIIRGIEKRNIVDDDQDRENFVNRLGEVAESTQTEIHAWALLDNHAHILLRSGDKGLPTFARRLLSGYASGYNRRHKRYGHLFQNRYKSIVVQEDSYFLELVRYIHLNPVRVGLVQTLAKLDYYQWSGHSVIVGRRKNKWQNVKFALKWFGRNQTKAKKAYRQFVKEGLDQGQRPELTGGGLVRSMGGWSAIKTLRKNDEAILGDERILGDSDFVSRILNEAEDQVKRQLSVQGDISEKLKSEIKKVCKQKGVTLSALRSGSRRRAVTDARKKLAVKFVRQWGVRLAEAARQLGVSTSAIAKIISRAD